MLTSNSTQLLVALAVAFLTPSLEAGSVDYGNLDHIGLEYLSVIRSFGPSMAFTNLDTTDLLSGDRFMVTLFYDLNHPLQIQSDSTTRTSNYGGPWGVHTYNMDLETFEGTRHLIDPALVGTSDGSSLILFTINESIDLNGDETESLLYSQWNFSLRIQTNADADSFGGGFFHPLNGVTATLGNSMHPFTLSPGNALNEVALSIDNFGDAYELRGNSVYSNGMVVPEPSSIGVLISVFTLCLRRSRVNGIRN